MSKGTRAGAASEPVLQSNTTVESNWIWLQGPLKRGVWEPLTRAGREGS
jgi:hypothetical protein